MNEIKFPLIRDYVYKNYPTYKNLTLVIKESNNHFKVYKHKDTSPLILGKGILHKI